MELPASSSLFLLLQNFFDLYSFDSTKMNPCYYSLLLNLKCLRSVKLSQHGLGQHLQPCAGYDDISAFSQCLYLELQAMEIERNQNINLCAKINLYNWFCRTKVASSFSQSVSHGWNSLHSFVLRLTSRPTIHHELSVLHHELLSKETVKPVSQFSARRMFF